MDENIPPSSLASLPPPPPSSAGAPGQMSYEGAPGSNGQANPHMPPPPLPPVVIPQNNNPIPTAMNSPSSGDILSPTSSGGFVRRAAPEPNKRALYVGGLDPRVTEEVLRQIFETTGHVQSVKIIPDKTVSATICLQLEHGPLLFLPIAWLWLQKDLLLPDSMFCLLYYCLLC